MHMAGTASRTRRKTARGAETPGSTRGGCPRGGSTAAGFYDQQYTQAESFDLAEIDASTLNDEIGMLRVVMRRVFEAAANEAASLADWQEALSTLSAAANRLANLLKANQKLEAASSEAGAALRQALSEMVAEMDEAERQRRP